jgi:hypothetical protein
LLLLFLFVMLSKLCFFIVVVVVHARILYGTNAQETKITLFGDGGDKLVGCFRRGIAAAAKKRKTENESACTRTRSYVHAFHSSCAAALLC